MFKRLGLSKYLIAIIFFGVVGTFVSAKLLTLEFHALKNTASFSACAINSVFDCSSVAKSQYNELFGFPNMILGTIYYPIIITFFGLLICKVKFPRWILYLMLIPTFFGLVFSFFLLYISFFLLFKICLYCLGSAISGTLIFILFNLYLLSSEERTYSPRLTSVYAKARASKYLIPVLISTSFIVYGLLVLFAKFYFRKYFDGDITNRSIIMFPLTFFKIVWGLIVH